MSCEYCMPKTAQFDNSEAQVMLNSLLSDMFVIYVKLYNYHWNVTGQNFSELHGLFQGQYSELIGLIDSVAERIRAIKGIALGTMQDFLSAAELQEGRSMQDWQSMLRDLERDYSVTSDKTGKMFNVLTQMGDNGSADLLLTVQAFLDKSAWMLRAYFSM